MSPPPEDSESESQIPKPAFDHVFPWSDFLERVSSIIPEIRRLRRLTRRDPERWDALYSGFLSQEDMEKVMSSVYIVWGEELKVRVRRDIMHYLCLNYDGFVEHGVIVNDEVPEGLLRALHFEGLNSPPRETREPPQVSEIVALITRFK